MQLGGWAEKGECPAGRPGIQSELVVQNLGCSGDRSGFDWDDVDNATALAVTELHGSLRESEQRVVATDTDVVAGVELGAALTKDDGAGVDCAAAEHLHAEALSVAIATVAG